MRLEVHGNRTQALAIVASIMEVADHPGVAVCWNSNAADLQREGLANNFRWVEKRLGATTHVRELGSKKYPYPELFKLLTQANYAGWILAEESRKVEDRVAALAEERKRFDQLVGA